ncbi:MAG: hypothetical protein LC620_08160 [Halobacteriales archaeon]|nr:hypothetical protein [Halobacteriales archaeon]
MRGWILVYRLPEGASQTDRVKFRQRLLGATTTSWEGRYSYHREGLLERIPHRFVMPGVVLVGPDHRAAVQAFLKKWKAALLIREVALEPEDLRHFGRRRPTS